MIKQAVRPFSTKKVGPFNLRWYSGESWFLWFGGKFLARYNKKTVDGVPRFRLAIGKLVVEYY